jgi:hypothetical protein
MDSDTSATSTPTPTVPSVKRHHINFQKSLHSLPHLFLGFMGFFYGMSLVIADPAIDLVTAPFSFILWSGIKGIFYSLIGEIVGMFVPQLVHIIGIFVLMYATFCNVWY